MAELSINTERVDEVAEEIRRLNDDINNSFTVPCNMVNELGGSWRSSSTETIIGKFYAIKNNYYTARYQTLKQYSDYLNQHGSLAYSATERQNASLADGFL